MHIGRIIIASDHNGIDLRNSIIQHCSFLGFKIVDLGIERDDKRDYIDITRSLVAEFNDGDIGVLICGSGIGVNIAANRYAKIRAALCYNEEYARLARKQNNANVLCLGSKTINSKEAIDCLTAFINTEFMAEKHGLCANKLSARITSHATQGINLIVRAIIVHQDHILLSTPSKTNEEFAEDLYFLPGGHVDYAEDARSALKRELKEEMNVEVYQSDFVGALECSWNRKKLLYHEINLIFKVELVGLSLDFPPNSTEAKLKFVWRPLSELYKYKILPAQLPDLIQQHFKDQSKSLFASEML